MNTASSYNRPMPTRDVKMLWIGILYFAEGFPFGLINNFFPIYFRDVLKLDLVNIGLMSLAAIPWTLKFLWAPFVDRFLERRKWIVASQAAMGVAIVATLSFGGEAGIGLGIMLFSMAALSATQDIAIDAYSIELIEPKELASANGLRNAMYRTALIAAGGGFVALADPFEGIGWDRSIVLSAVLMLLISIVSLKMPRIPSRPQHETTNEIILQSVNHFFSRPGFVLIILFILTFKLGDLAMAPMVNPFWVDSKFSAVNIGIALGTVGAASAIIGALIGGWLTERMGIFHGLWILGLAQAGSNLVYATVANVPHPSIGFMYAASTVEAFSGGLGTAPFLAFLMGICDKQRPATQFAFLSAIFGLTRVIGGACSGFFAKQWGYSLYFTVTFFLALPSFLFLPWVKRWIHDDRNGS